jgi:hypothetical protein
MWKDSVREMGTHFLSNAGGKSQVTKKKRLSERHPLPAKRGGATHQETDRNESERTKVTHSLSYAEGGRSQNTERTQASECC